MEHGLLKLFLERGFLIFLPFVGWYLWRAMALRTGRPMGSTPWSWLFAAGIGLLAVSLTVTALLRPDTRNQIYVPAQTREDGAVIQGHFETKAPPTP